MAPSEIILPSFSLIQALINSLLFRAHFKLNSTDTVCHICSKYCVKYSSYKRCTWHQISSLLSQSYISVGLSQLPLKILNYSDLTICFLLQPAKLPRRYRTTNFTPHLFIPGIIQRQQSLCIDRRQSIHSVE